MRVTNSLSAFSLSLAVLSALWTTCIHYLSLAPETTAACLCNCHMLCFSPTYWEDCCYIVSFISTHRELFPVPWRCATLQLFPKSLLSPKTINARYNRSFYHQWNTVRWALNYSKTLPSFWKYSSITGTIIRWEETHIRIQPIKQ